jgi:hypothetical protein
MRDDKVIVELERKLEALSIERRSVVAAELLQLLLLGTWPLKELRQFFFEREEVPLEKLQTAKRAREKRIKSFTVSAFIALPLRPGPNFSYQDIVRPACLWEGIRPLRVDHEIKESDLIPKLHHAMDTCDLFVADLTEANANVYYEVGYLEKASKPGLFLKAGEEEALFYLRSRDIILMPPGPEGVAWSRSQLRASLRKKRAELRH